MFVRVDWNRYGTPRSNHVCNICRRPFTVTPAQTEEEFGGNCLDETCPSYDPARDADKLFGDPSVPITREPIAPMGAMP